MKKQKQTPKPQYAWVAVWIDDWGGAPLGDASYIAPTRSRLMEHLQPHIPEEWSISRVILTPAPKTKKRTNAK